MQSVIGSIDSSVGGLCSEEADVLVATYHYSADVEGQIIDIYTVNHGVTQMWFGVLRLTGEIKMMGIAY